MASQRHKDCMIRDSSAKTKNPSGVNVTVSKNCASSKLTNNIRSTTSSKLLQYIGKTTFVSKLPVPIVKKVQKAKAVSTNGLLNFKGMSITDVNQVDASKSTDVVSSARAMCVDSSVGTEVRAMHVDSSVGTEARALLVDSSVGTEVRAMHVDSSVGTEARALLVDSSVGTEARALFADSAVGTEARAIFVDSSVGSSAPHLTVGTVFKYVKRHCDLNVVHLELDNEPTFEFYINKLAKLSGSDMNETVREICQNLISDEVLKEYSYFGQRNKSRFKDYDNITKLIVASTIESLKRKYFAIHKKVKVESDDEREKLYNDVKTYFTTEYMKHAKARYDRPVKRITPTARSE